MHFTDGDQFNQFLERYDDHEEEWKAASTTFTSLGEYIEEIPEADLDKIDRTKDVGKYSDHLALVKEGEDYFIKPTVDSKILRNLISQNGNIVIDNILFHTTWAGTDMDFYTDERSECSGKQEPEQYGSITFY